MTYFTHLVRLAAAAVTIFGSSGHAAPTLNCGQPGAPGTAAFSAYIQCVNTFCQQYGAQQPARGCVFGPSAFGANGGVNIGGSGANGGVVVATGPPGANVGAFGTNGGLNVGGSGANGGVIVVDAPDAGSIGANGGVNIGGSGANGGVIAVSG